MVDFFRLPLRILSKFFPNSLISIGLCILVFVNFKIGKEFELGMSSEWEGLHTNAEQGECLAFVYISKPRGRSAHFSYPYFCVAFGPLRFTVWPPLVA